MEKVVTRKKPSLLKNCLTFSVSKLYALSGLEKELVVLFIQETSKGAKKSILITCDCNINLQKTSKAMIVGLVHPECHTAEFVSELMYISDCSVISKKRLNSNSNWIQIRWKKPSGKVTVQVESYKLDDLAGLVSSNVIGKEEQNDENEILPFSTFRLALSEKEELDRKQVVLPFTKKSIESQKTSSQIFYEPDAGDDFDEEDPDEDLTF
ncbi:elongator complex protein 5-like isoform X2 [Artemia franciscana]|uniref:elongator complex protein 5-like isoform X2 n=1 Tax=Artemia franciscana TaxID=6661 RepID=UPI0032DBE648